MPSTNLKQQLLVAETKLRVLEKFQDLLGRCYNNIPKIVRVVCDFIYELNNDKEVKACFFPNRDFKITEASFSSKHFMLYSYKKGKHSKNNFLKTFNIKNSYVSGVLKIYSTAPLNKKTERFFDDLVENFRKAVQRLSIFLQDSLTGFYTRSFLEKAFHRVDGFLSRFSKEKVALFFIDLDGFKDVNDVFGHDFGDEILKEFSKVLRKNLRKSDIIIRYGGDEFIVIAYLGFKEKPLQPMFKITSRVSTKIKKYFGKRLFGLLKSKNNLLRKMAKEFLKKRTELLSVSIGFSEYKSKNQKLLLKKTDQATYYCKGIDLLKRRVPDSEKKNLLSFPARSKNILFSNNQFYLLVPKKKFFLLYKIITAKNNKIYTSQKAWKKIAF